MASFVGTSTDVSLYYTMSVTRSDAYDIAVPTPDSSGNVVYTSTRMQDGQIFPTAQCVKEPGSSAEDPGSGAEESGSGAEDPGSGEGAATTYAGPADLLVLAALAAIGL